MGWHWLSAPLAIAGITLVTGAASADPTDQAIDAARAGDFGTALGILVPEAGDGNAHAEFVLGILYEGGLGVVQDMGEAADLYRQSAQQGLSTAQNNLASLYAAGTGVPQDVGEAIKWWQLAANQGLSTAQLNLAEEYATGTNAPQDYVLSYKWAALAAAQGEDGAADLLMKVTAAMSPEQIAAAQALVQSWNAAARTGA